MQVLPERFQPGHRPAEKSYAPAPKTFYGKSNIPDGSPHLIQRGLQGPPDLQENSIPQNGTGKMNGITLFQIQTSGYRKRLRHSLCNRKSANTVFDDKTRHFTIPFYSKNLLPFQENTPCSENCKSLQQKKRVFIFSQTIPTIRTIRTARTTRDRPGVRGNGRGMGGERHGGCANFSDDSDDSDDSDSAHYKG